MGYLGDTYRISTGYLGDTNGVKIGCTIKLEEKKKYNFFNKTVENYM